MRYMTWDLLAQAQSADHEIVERVTDQWFSALDCYQTRLDELRSKLPAGVLALLEIDLHHAKLLSHSIDPGSSKAYLRIRLDERSLPTAAEFSIEYDLVRPLRLSRETASIGASRLWTDILYDEIDADALGVENVFTHSLLFADGAEMQFDFRDLRIERFEAADSVASQHALASVPFEGLTTTERIVSR